MGKNITKRFTDKIFERALADANHLLSPKEDRIKMLIKITSAALFLALLVGLIVAKVVGAVTAFNTIIVTIAVDVAFFLMLQYFPRIIASFTMWKYAAKLHESMGGMDAPHLIFDARKRYQGKTSPGWVIFRIENKSKYPLEDCGIRIEKIEPPIFSSVSEDIWLDWSNQSGVKKVQIKSEHSVEWVVVSWMGSEPRRDVFEFATTVEYEHGCKGELQKYKVFLEITGVYLWEKYTYHRVVEVEPNHDDKSVEIRMIENEN